MCWEAVIIDGSFLALLLCVVLKVGQRWLLSTTNHSLFKVLQLLLEDTRKSEFQTKSRVQTGAGHTVSL